MEAMLKMTAVRKPDDELIARIKAAKLVLLHTWSPMRMSRNRARWPTNPEPRRVCQRLLGLCHATIARPWLSA